MMKRPELHLVGDRFFARLRSFALECPSCGHLWGTGKGYHLSSCYNPRTQLFVCPTCSKRLRLGIVAWPTERGHSPTRPEDCMPTSRQLLRMKEQSTLGLWVEATVDGKRVRKGRNQPVNAVSRKPEVVDLGPGNMLPDDPPRGFTKKVARQVEAWKKVEGGEGQGGEG